MKRRVLLVILLAAWTRAALDALPPPEDSWIELHTANFTLYSDAGEKKTRAIGADLERLRDALAQLSPGVPLSSPVPTYLFVFRNAAAFRPYQKTYNGQPLPSGGYFLARQLANYVAIDGDQHGDEREVIYHEYIHSVMHNNAANLPLWLHEGLAEYYSTFTVGKSEARIGLPIAEHLTWLRHHDLIPLAALFRVDEHSPEYNETSRRGAFYAESWALVHYLFSGDPERRRQAVESLRLARAGATPDGVLPQVFGDAAGLERELRLYLRRPLFDSTRVPIRPEANLAMVSQPLARPDLLYRLGDLLANLSDDHREAAAEHFRAALAARPDHGSALAGLGLLEEQAGRPEAARPYYARAAGLAPDDLTVQYLYARSCLQDPDAGSLPQARAALKRVVMLKPDFGEAWADLGYSYRSENALPAEAVQALETAHRLLPARTDVAHNLVLAYARSGQTGKAEALIESVLVPAGDPEKVESAREALIDEEQLRAEKLINDDRLAEGLALLEQVRNQTRQTHRRDRVTRRLEEIRQALRYQAFIEGYNHAVDLANRGDVQGATAILEPLIESAADPVQAERARAFLNRLLPPKNKKKP